MKCVMLLALFPTIMAQVSPARAIDLDNSDCTVLFPDEPIPKKMLYRESRGYFTLGNLNTLIGVARNHIDDFVISVSEVSEAEVKDRVNVFLPKTEQKKFSVGLSRGQKYFDPEIKVECHERS